jgi:hypothetical protein
MDVRRVSISEFKAHCTEEIREVEKGGARVGVRLPREDRPDRSLGRQREGHRALRARLRSGRTCL